ncbi:MAG: hypothetical protein GKR97_10050 [Rhizobiaceae bacterium]|nr:hypothetical protein [Rhizobiaceae bacterium]
MKEKAKGNLRRNHVHCAGYDSLVAEVIAIALLDYKRKRLGEESASAAKQKREYAKLVADNERTNLNWFLFGGGMDFLVDLAKLNINPDCIREALKK